MYLFGFIPIHSIELLMTGIYYEKYSPIDLKLMENRKLSFETSTIVGRSMNLFVGLFSKFGKILSYILVAIQVLNFVQESADGVTSKIFNIFSENSLGERKSDIQFPVKKLNEAEALNLSENQCPLCLKKRENDTVLSCSGYIFCFKCIYQFISKYGRCPVTSIPATTKELVKMYV
ncbi:Peroxisome assembly protein 12 [Strongyloides ratti]|uniref:Peroxisome assembly protein 12 n=1 Tax=Strongyloides ratti TaxID=34506 RepID=A0A090MUL8_STRRB|nr:Peroxisome assembly protein 12 [Strongyloides ratti]CEF62293.1 Peroxisome assembly protein 12 [Strongyloides ratti]